MAAGYALGPVIQARAGHAPPPAVRAWLAITVGFVVLRATNLYGDPARVDAAESVLATVLSFINCEKYPPSLLYLMMTLGPGLMLLAVFESARGRLAGLDHHLRARAVLLLCRAHLS